MITESFQAERDWGPVETAALTTLLALALQEDLGGGDVTTLSLVPPGAQGRAAIVARQAGVMAGLPAARQSFLTVEPRVIWTSLVSDGTAVEAGQAVAEISGPAQGLLSGERTALNFLGRLSGIATLTSRYVEAVQGTRAGIYDTRKTTPGWRRLEKYAVRAGGGRNHRLGLFDMVLIKDNHLAFGAEAEGRTHFTLAEAVARGRKLAPPGTGLEIEVDSLAQLAEVLPAGPDLVLLDNMDSRQLREAVALRDRLRPQTVLEASGGVNLQTVAEIARSGVERISVGALTHSAIALDVALDWK